jgi:hypothetical protein
MNGERFGLYGERLMDGTRHQIISLLANSKGLQHLKGDINAEL